MRAWGGFSRRSEREFASRPHPTATMQNIITLALAAGALASAMPEKIQTTFVDHVRCYDQSGSSRLTS